MPTRCRVLSPLPETFVEARRFVRDSMAPNDPPQLLDDMLLLTTELVTNAVVHGGRDTGDPIEVIVSVGDRRVRVAVRDTGLGFDPGERRVRGEQGGWGLHLVELLSSRWGVDRGGTGTLVWFEIDRRIPRSRA